MEESLQIIETPIGYLKIQASSIGLRSIHFLQDQPAEHKEIQNQFTKQATKELLEYFDGKRKEFSVDLDWEGYTDFYKSVWSYLLKIPSGQTRSYGDVARHLENPGASRAVGLANGKNPIPIIVPCHRVIGSNGSLTGFASGLHIKQQLLALENPESFSMQGKLF